MSKVALFLCTCYSRVSVYDLRQAKEVVSFLSSADVTHVQIDEWKVVTGDIDGFVSAWDQRMVKRKLWDLHNRYTLILC